MGDVLNRRDYLAIRYTNSTSYDDLGIGLKEAIDRIIYLEDKLFQMEHDEYETL